MAAFVFAAVMCWSAPVSAQQSDEDAVRAVVKKLFDGMRTRDTTMMRSVFHADAKMYGVGRTGAVEMNVPADFVRSIASAPPNMVLDEVLHDTEVMVDGPLATVWTYYDFFAGERFSHCGYDSFLMLKTAGEWKIVSLADSRRSEGCKQKRS
jgi:hypothetical protein